MKLNNYTLLPNLCSIIIMLITTNLTAQNYFPWYKTYGESGRAIDICQTVDSGYVVAGENYQYYPHRVWLLHTDYLGDTLWSKVYDNICNDDDHLFVRAVIQAADGGYVILSNCIDQYLSTKDILLLKTNQQGDLEFLGRYERGYVYDFLETKDGGFIIAGEISGDAALLKVNSQGDSIWTQIYGIGDRSYALSIKALTDSEYVVTGSVEVGISPSDKNVFILKINSTGDTLISRIFENPNSNDFVISVDVTDYGNYIVAG